MKNIILFFVPVMLVFTACEEAFFEDDVASTSPMENFDYLWTECKEKYAYFALKDIDWDAVRKEYSAKISEGMSEDSLFSVLGDMLAELRDDHTGLVSPFNISRFGTRYLGQDNFDERIVVDHYIGQDFYVSGPFIHDFLNNEAIGYVRLPAFAGTVDNDNLDFILERYADTKGLILDLRENGGGSVTDIFNLLERLVEEETIVYYSRIKNGPGRDDFSEPEAARVKPYDGIRYAKKVAVLVDRATYSAGSFTSLATKALSNVILVGDTTGGGLGLPNGGQLPNGWTYRFSITQALDLNLNPEFENGVPPDVPALFDWDDLTTDEVLERAILELQ
ncbi:S41 family peptidase [Tunicatimonas pelagia]|uniref:S41 family peptidase n=1 Tax=Tunicatimonas pelagia TaxID=931531 RepID=UPI002664EC0F|nr:S41 family peptidase [Tunicatimonas pelagia]WKN40560.1 S41 family peptidase [Tunicatimonas pelagia]